MTLFISIFSILMVILPNHPTNSGTVPKSNLQVLTEVRLQRSSAGSGQKLGKSKQKSERKLKRKSKRKGKKSAKRRAQTKLAKRKFMDRKFDPNFEFRACDYLDLVEVGYI